MSVLTNHPLNFGWGRLVQFSRQGCIAALEKIQRGKLEIIDIDCKKILCGDAADDELDSKLKVHNDTFWVRLAFFNDMGFAESYMLGEISTANFVNFFKICILNRSALCAATSWTSWFSNKMSGFLRATNTLANSRLNTAAHYDISNTMFASFLSADMTYSCPIWLPKTDPRHLEEPLEEAQERKLARFIRNSRIKHTDRVLEIGTGWGSFAIKAARETGCSVTSLTLSVEQKELAEERIRAAGLSERIAVLLCDYRDLKIHPSGSLPGSFPPFDKIVSIEMLEAVGREYLSTFFSCVDTMLKRDGGIACFQTITIPEERYEAYSRGDDFIRRYIFPGGHLPSVSKLVSSIELGSKGSLIVDDIENIGPHYAKTLRVWRENFQRNFESTIKPALLKEHKDMDHASVDVFRRKWEYYFTYCEAGFATKTLGDVIVTVGREGAMELCEDVPL